RLAKAATANRHQAVEFVDEDDGWGDLAGAVEQPGDLLLALAVPFGKQIRRFGSDEVRFRLARGGLGEESLARAGRPIEEEALGRPDAEAPECIGMLQRELDTFSQAVTRGVEASDIVPA